MTFDEACEFASKWTPWGLLPADGGTIQGEEQFYLQQPSYGTSYVIGKIAIEHLIAEYARQRADDFRLEEFMDEFNGSGIIPVSLILWEMTGDKSMLNEAPWPPVGLLTHSWHRPTKSWNSSAYFERLTQYLRVS